MVNHEDTRRFRRRRSDRFSDDPFEEEVIGSLDEAFDVMVEASGAVHRNAAFLSKVVRSFYVRALRPMAWVVSAIVVITVLQTISLALRDENVDQINEKVSVLDKDLKELQNAVEAAKIASEKAEKASVEATTASEAAKVSLDEAVAQAQRGGINPEVLTALNKINEMYDVCVERKEC